MLRKLLCRVGWHHWEFRTTPSGPLVTTTGRCAERCEGAGEWRIIDQRPSRAADIT